MIDKTEEMNDLLDMYAVLLTPRQQQITKEYYYEDFSLSEIAQRLNISRSAVADHLHRSEERLQYFEKNLLNVASFHKRKQIYDKMKRANKEELLKYITQLENCE